jgi:hypothetical protein
VKGWLILCFKPDGTTVDSVRLEEVGWVARVACEMGQKQGIRVEVFEADLNPCYEQLEGVSS